MSLTVIGMSVITGFTSAKRGLTGEDVRWIPDICN